MSRRFVLSDVTQMERKYHSERVLGQHRRPRFSFFQHSSVFKDHGGRTTVGSPLGHPCKASNRHFETCCTRRHKNKPTSSTPLVNQGTKPSALPRNKRAFQAGLSARQRQAVVDERLIRGFFGGGQHLSSRKMNGIVVKPTLGPSIGSQAVDS